MCDKSFKLTIGFDCLTRLRSEARWHRFFDFYSPRLFEFSSMQQEQVVSSATVKCPNGSDDSGTPNLQPQTLQAKNRFILQIGYMAFYRGVDWKDWVCPTSNDTMEMIMQSVGNSAINDCRSTQKI
uniref:Uncharacterized protein n=1 Tax=Globodera rostochiensis TaxID=31243 RepID=A0A914HS57_GLORO